MSFLPSYPFQRLIVHSTPSGTVYVGWYLHSDMQDPGPYRWQLQVARTPNASDTGWENVGPEVQDAPFLTDSVTPVYGYTLDRYYRVLLTTGRGKYLSSAFGCFGTLTPREWKLAIEIRRKERLRSRYTAVPVTVLKRRRYGEPCTECTNSLSEGSSNSQCPVCYGTGYVGGYHVPFHLQMMDLSPSQLREVHYSDNVATVNRAEDRYQARAAGVPELYSGDIIVAEETGQRFKVTSAPVIAQMHHVPLVRQVDMCLLPYSDAAYQIGTAVNQPVLGCGPVIVNENYGGTGNLVYADAGNEPVTGAEVRIYDSENALQYKTVTLEGGAWQNAVALTPGAWKLEFQHTLDTVPAVKMLEIAASEVPGDSAYAEEQKREQIDYFSAFQ